MLAKRRNEEARRPVVMLRCGVAILWRTLYIDWLRHKCNGDAEFAKLVDAVG